MLGSLLIGVCIGLVAGVVIVINDIVKRKGKRRIVLSSPDEASDVDTGTKVMLGAMGAKLLDNQIEKRENESERKWKETLNWQDAARDEDDSCE